jgi:hypothetical protein
VSSEIRKSQFSWKNNLFSRKKQFVFNGKTTCFRWKNNLFLLRKQNENNMVDNSVGCRALRFMPANNRKKDSQPFLFREKMAGCGVVAMTEARA